MRIAMIGFPHDILKPFDWKSHANPGVLPEDVRVFISKYRVSCASLKDWGQRLVEKELTLEQVLRGHYEGRRKDASLWERLWHEADCISAVVSRLRYEFDYWYEGQADPFLVKVYGDIIFWNSEKRREVSDRVFSLLKENSGDPSKHDQTLDRVNDLLREFPADSRFPFVGLRTHHLITDILRRDKVFIDRIRQRASLDKLYLLRVSISEPSFHRLKKLRGFSELRSHIVKAVEMRLKDRYPIIIGDDLYIFAISGREVADLRREIYEAGFGVDLAVFEWHLEKSDSLYEVRELSEPISISLGAVEDWEFKPERSAEYAQILEGNFDLVLWVSLSPVGGMEELANEFLNWAEGELERRYRDKRKEVEGPLRQEISLCPDLMISVAEGYDQFVLDCGKALNREDPDLVTAVRSFSRSLLVKGLKDGAGALNIYLTLLDLKGSLHIPVRLSAVVCSPKHPFWRVLELVKLNLGKEDNITFVVGEKVTRLKNEHARLIESVVPLLQNERKRQFYKIVNSACSDEKEILKVKIRGLASEKKLRGEVSSKLCWLADRVADGCRNEEERREVTCEIFKVLRMFTK